MSLFSFFGKKERQSDALGLGGEVVPSEMRRSVSVQDDAALKREAEQLKAQRDLARKTAEKIDAIESEIARDILKAPHPTICSEHNPSASQPVPDGPPSANPFQPTILTLSSEHQRVLLRSDKDK